MEKMPIAEGTKANAVSTPCARSPLTPVAFFARVSDRRQDVELLVPGRLLRNTLNSAAAGSCAGGTASSNLIRYIHVQYECKNLDQAE